MARDDERFFVSGQLEAPGGPGRRAGVPRLGASGRVPLHARRGAPGAEPGDRPPRLRRQLGRAPTPPPPLKGGIAGAFKFRPTHPRRGGPRLVTSR